MFIAPILSAIRTAAVGQMSPYGVPEAWLAKHKFNYEIDPSTLTSEAEMIPITKAEWLECSAHWNARIESEAPLPPMVFRGERLFPVRLEYSLDGDIEVCRASFSKYDPGAQANPDGTLSYPW